MYLYRVKIKAEIVSQITEQAKRYGYGDMFMARDLFVFTVRAGTKLPTEKRISELVTLYLQRRIAGMSKDRLGLLLRKRKMLLADLGKSAIFKAAIVSDPSPLVQFTNLLLMMKKGSVKVQQAICATCKHGKNCNFAKKYSASMGSSISAITDPDYASLVHADCPARPDLDLGNSAYAAMQLMQGKTTKELEEMFKQQQEMRELMEAAGGQLTDGEPVDPDKDIPIVPLGDGSLTVDGNTSEFNGQRVFRTIDTLVDSIKIADLVIYEFARNLSKALTSSYKGKYTPKTPKSLEKHIDQMQETKDVVNALPSELGSDSDILDAKIAKKTVAIRENIGREEKPQLFVLLIDASGSMLAATCQSAILNAPIITRAQIASIFGEAIIKHVIGDKGEVLLSFFDVSTTTPYIIKDKLTQDHGVSMLQLQSFCGGGTDLNQALKLTEAYIRGSAKEYSDAEILVITDMDTSISAEIKALFVGKDKVPLNCLDVKPEATDYGNARTVLKEICRNYCKLNFNELDPKKIVSVLK